MTYSQTIEILARRKLRDKSQGGYNSLTVGPPGSGKTSQLLFEARNIMKWYPDELIFWRDSPKGAAQFNRIGNRYEVFAEKGIRLKFRDLENGNLLDIDYKYFKNFNELIHKDTKQGLVKSGQLNVVFFKNDYRWIDLMEHLRSTIGWQSVFLDEVEDICPLNPGKRPGEERNIRNEKNIFFSNNAKALRRGLIHLFADTQNVSELDWRFIGKLNFICYLRGARAFSASRIKQVAIDSLSMGEVWIDWENRLYGKSVFPAFPPIEPVFEVIIE